MSYLIGLIIILLLVLYVRSLFKTLKNQPPQSSDDAPILRQDIETVKKMLRQSEYRSD